MIRFYIVLIGTFMMGILVVLWIGSHLVAPPAIHGSWSMALAAGSTAYTECLEASGWTNPTTLHVSQSGEFLELSFGESGYSAMPGRLQDMVITAPSPDVGDARAEAAIEAGHVTHLVADVQRAPEIPDQLAGQLSIAGCDESVTFTATDRVVTHGQSGGGGH